MTRQKFCTTNLNLGPKNAIPKIENSANATVSSIKETLDVDVGFIHNKNHPIISLYGSHKNVLRAKYVLETLYKIIENRQKVSVLLLEDLIKDSADRNTIRDNAYINVNKKMISMRTPNQSIYFDAMHKNSLCFGVGPAGTGKTYLSVCFGLHLLLSGLVKKIILTRPILEAGENLGFLPGDFREKIDPYLRPVYDALHDLMTPETLKRYLHGNIIEIAPLAYMRGRTLKDAFILLDEAQNTTIKQMQMFLTRLGGNSTMVVTGDTSQIDLPKERSGLLHVLNIVRDMKDISVTYFDSADIMRHPLVARMVKAYNKQNQEKA